MSTDALIMFIAGDILPLSIVDSPTFRHFVEKLDPKYQVPCRKHLSTKLLVEKASEVQNNMKEKMSLAKSVNLTIDLWSNRQMRAFMGITGHFIQDWTAHSVMLSCKRFKGKHTAESIRYEYGETLAVFEIADKIFTIVTDNASNMVKAFKTSLPGFEDTTDDGDSGNDKPEDVDCEDKNEDELEHLPNHSRCYAHTLQLVIKDGLKDCTSHMCTVIAKASKIVSFVRRSIHASEMLESENKLQAANVTRWNSQLTMIRSILKIVEEKLNEVESPVQFSSYERKILHELSLILDPFEYVTLLVQNNVNASLTIPVTLGLKHKVNQLSNLYNNKIVTTLKSSIETRLTQFEEDNDFILAAILDPRFKLR
ncbi:Hypothetical predicted protein [Mytilus galloprovincialis]|uniref:Uncharacterized protein n=1 Tax=Mytilus galloprovincialis TaxID=29158 RepID=A0A8B6FBE7_MYTGA|nr:Hypothetical predicted protein [Mytilus galloprovincialis]